MTIPRWLDRLIDWMVAIVIVMGLFAMLTVLLITLFAIWEFIFGELIERLF